jgi:cation diffusion facilitator family transporter
VTVCLTGSMSRAPTAPSSSHPPPLWPTRAPETSGEWNTLPEDTLPHRTQYAAAARAARLMLTLNVLLCASKLLTGWLGGSYALVADGVNNLTDIGISIALYLGLRIARLPADDEHAYGHGKFEQEISRVIAIVVLVTGGGIIVGAIRRAPHIHEPPAAAVLVVAAASIAVKTFMYLYQNRVARRLSSSALAADALNHKSDVAATSCVLLGTSAVWIGGPTCAPADDYAAIVVGLLMVLAAAHTIHTASGELLDRMPPRHMVEHIRRLAGNFPGIRGVDQIVGRKTGMHYLIDLHLEVPGDMTVDRAHLLGHRVKDWLMAELPEIMDIVVHLEPERAREEDWK